MYRKIWVTGGTGLVGAALKSIEGDYPEREFIFTGSKDCNLLLFSPKNLENSKDILYEQDPSRLPDAIIHLAAVSGGIDLSTKHPAIMLRDNTLMSINILELSRYLGVKKTVMTLSTGMYAANAPVPILEESIHNGRPDESNYGYAFAKRLIEPLIKAYRAEYGLDVIGLVPNGIIGENSNYSYGASTVVAALIRRFYESREGNSKIVVWGDGSPLREFTYAKDIARAFMWCLDNYDRTDIVHIGTTEEHTIGDIAYMIADILGIDKGRIQFDASKPSGQFRKATDNSRFMGLSGFKYTPFRVALENTISWFCKHYRDNTLRL